MPLIPTAAFPRPARPSPARRSLRFIIPCPRLTPPIAPFVWLRPFLRPPLNSSTQPPPAASRFSEAVATAASISVLRSGSKAEGQRPTGLQCPIGLIGLIPGPMLVSGESRPASGRSTTLRTSTPMRLSHRISSELDRSPSPGTRATLTAPSTPIFRAFVCTTW